MTNRNRADFRDEYHEVVELLYEWGAWYELMLTSDNIGFPSTAAGFTEYISGYRETNPARMPFSEIGDDTIDEDRAVETDRLISKACKGYPHLLWSIVGFYARQTSYRTLAVEYSNYKVPHPPRGASKDVVSALNKERAAHNDYKSIQKWVLQAVARIDAIKTSTV